MKIIISIDQLANLLTDDLPKKSKYADPTIT